MAGGGEQLLRIVPEKVIEFPVAPYRSTAAQLQLENISSSYVAFKIKTTAPKSYLVRPSTGIIPAGEKETVQIVFQAATEELPRPCTDRFLIQSTAVPSSAPLARDHWQSLDKDRIEDTRLSVAFHRMGAQGGFGGAMVPGSAASGGNTAPMGEQLHAGAGLSGPFGGSVAAPAVVAGGSYVGVGRAAPVPGTTLVGGGSAYPEDLKNRYDQLVDYALALERHKEELVKENETLKQQLSRKAATTHKTGGMGFFELWHFPVYVFIGVIIWYLLGKSGDATTSAHLSHR